MPFLRWLRVYLFWTMLTAGAGIAVLAAVTGSLTGAVVCAAIGYAGYRGTLRYADTE